MSADDFIRRGLPKAIAESTWTGTYTWTIQDGKGQLEYKEPGGGFICLANMEFVDNVVRISYYQGDACNGSVEDIHWRLDPDGLHLHLVAIQNSNFINNRAMYEAKAWQQAK